MVALGPYGRSVCVLGIYAGCGFPDTARRQRAARHRVGLAISCAQLLLGQRACLKIPAVQGNASDAMLSEQDHE